jgi:hypothetical protein
MVVGGEVAAAETMGEEVVVAAEAAKAVLVLAADLPVETPQKSQSCPLWMSLD